MKRRFSEAVESGSDDSQSFDSLFNQSYRKHIDDEKQDVEKVLPTEMSARGQRYIEMLMSTQLDALVAKLERLTGVKAHDEQTVSRLAFAAFNKISQLERGHEKQLAEAAVSVVLDLPEYKMIKDLVDAGHIKIDAQIKTPNLTGAMQEWEKQKQEEEKQNKVPENDLSEIESQDLDLIQELISDDKSKRQFIDYITQGAAVNAWDIYHLASDVIRAINPQLMEMYPTFTASVHSLYFIRGLLNVSGMTDGAVGMSGVDDDGEGAYVIRAHGVNFVVVLHELIKGVYDFIGLHGPEDQGGTINDEVYHLTGGGPLAAKFRQNLLSMLDGKVEMLLPVITKIYSADTSNDEVRDILNNTPSAKRHILRLASEYQQALDDHNNHGVESEYDSEWSPESDDDDEDGGELVR